METFDKMLAAYEASNAPRITEMNAIYCPKNCKRAWTVRSNRGWYALEDKLASRASRGPGCYPLLVEADDGEFYMCAAAAKLLNPSLYAKPDRRISRKGYYLMTEDRLREMADQRFFADWCWRSTNAHTTGDTIDVALFVLRLKGVDVNGASLIKSFATAERGKPITLAA